MSFLITPLVNTGLYVTFTAAGNLIYYTGCGIWWLGKRIVYGRQLSAQEIMQRNQELLLEQNQELRQQLQDIVKGKVK